MAPANAMVYVSVETEPFSEAMPNVAELEMTILEAAFVSGVSARAINHEIDERIIEPTRSSHGRKIRGVDLVYLGAIRSIRVHLGHELRLRIRQAIVEASGAGKTEAVVDRLRVALPDIQNEVLQASERLERIKHVEIETRSAVLAGEPVLRGTRVAARHVAELVRRGESQEAIAVDLDLTPAQIEAAVAFASIAPKIGRPPRDAGKPDVPASR